MNDHNMQGTESIQRAFVDSGTTFTYLPRTLWDSLMYHFDYFCELTKDIKHSDGMRKHCPGKRFMAKS